MDNTEPSPVQQYTPGDLKQRTLSYFDCARGEWIQEQLRACLAMTDRYKSFACIKYGYHKLGHARITKFIKLVSKIFFKDKLKNVKFKWHDAAKTWPVDKLATAVAFTAESKDSATIMFNLSHPRWQYLPVNRRLCEFVGTLLHECIHVLIGQYSMTDVGHGALWQIISEAVERHASDILGVELDLCRATSLVYEHEKFGKIDLSQDDLKICFGNGFWYSAVTHTLFNMGYPLNYISDKQKEVCEPSRPSLVEEDVFICNKITYWGDSGAYS